MAPDYEGLAYLSEFFEGRKNGYLIDVGAADGVKPGSMSRFLMERGWGGMLVEPLPQFYQQLMEAYWSREDVVTVQAACSDEEGEAELFPCRGVTTMEPEWRDACAAWWKHVEYGPSIFVPKRTLKSLLDEHQAPDQVDLLEIDTEGHDFHVLRGMDWGRRPSLVIVEALDMRHPERRMKKGRWKLDLKLVEYMKQQGYRCHRSTQGGNAIFLRENHS